MQTEIPPLKWMPGEVFLIDESNLDEIEVKSLQEQIDKTKKEM